jgi:hypothetical protein
MSERGKDFGAALALLAWAAGLWLGAVAVVLLPPLLLGLPAGWTFAFLPLGLVYMAGYLTLSVR